MELDITYIGRHHAQQSFHAKYRGDNLASTAIPSLGGYGVAELEPFEAQERGFQHGHGKNYAIPNTREREIVELFRDRTDGVAQLGSGLQGRSDSLR